MITEFTITPGETRKRLDVFLCHRERDISRSGIQRLIELGRIRLNALVVKPSHIIKPGDRITMDTPQPEQMHIEGKDLSLDVLHEDDSVLVINKPANIVVHPTSGNWSGTLLNALLLHFRTHQGHETQLKPQLVHRLDKQTSGVMVIAKTADAVRVLTSQFEKHSITRMYEALVLGIPQNTMGMIDVAIGRDRNNPKTISTQTDQPKQAMTEFRVMKHFGKVASHIQLHPHTGRTHQLRVHLASIGHPILGDSIYGEDQVGHIDELSIPRVMLHARTLGFQHPTLHTFQEYSADSPQDLQTVRNHLERLL